MQRMEKRKCTIKVRIESRKTTYLRVVLSQSTLICFKSAMETPEQCVLWKHQNNAFYGNNRTMRTIETPEQCVLWKHQNNAYNGNTRTMRTMETPEQCVLWKHQNMRTMETPE